MLRDLDDEFSLRYESRINCISLGYLVDGLPSATCCSAVGPCLAGDGGSTELGAAAFCDDGKVLIVGAAVGQVRVLR